VRTGRRGQFWREWALPGLAAILVGVGALLLAAGCGTRNLVSTIPPDVGTTAPAAATAPGRTMPMMSPGHTMPVTSRAAPVRIVIPAIGVDAPVMQLGLNADRTIQVPPLGDHNLAGWYKYGSSPGQPGPAVIVGHIDSYQGASVFYRLRYLVKGDQVRITLANGQVVTFAVDGLQQVSKTAFPTQSVYGFTKDPELRLVTCGGDFNPATGSYLSDIIVYAHLTG